MRGLPLRRTGRSSSPGASRLLPGRRSTGAIKAALGVHGVGGGGVRSCGGREGEVGGTGGADGAGEAVGPRGADLGTPAEEDTPQNGHKLNTPGGDALNDNKKKFSLYLLSPPIP